MLRATSALDFERNASYAIGIRATDPSGLSASATVTVRVVDVNDIAISSVIPGGSSLSTQGGTSVTLVGANFGPVNAASRSDVGVVVSYVGSDSWRYNATNCAVTETNVKITCAAAAGVGKDHAWTVAIASPGAETWQKTSAAAVTSYAQPALASIAGAGAMPTAGGATVTISGSNFGPDGDAFARVFYGAAEPATGQAWDYECSSATVSAGGTRVTCQTAAGAGGGMVWQVAVGREPVSTATGQYSNATDFSGATGYEVPAVTNVALPQGPLSTRGGGVIIVNGTGFGVVGGALSLAYTNGAQSYVASSCEVIVAHQAARCIAAVGIGSSHRVRVTLSGQQSSSSSDTISYRAPSVQADGEGTPAVTGKGVASATTAGGQQMFIDGSDFGPAGTVPAVTYGPTGVEYTAVDCSILVEFSRISCLTAWLKTHLVTRDLRPAAPGRGRR